MRVHNRAERVFIARLVADVRTLVDMSQSASEKATALQTMAEIQSHRIAGLRHLLERVAARDASKADRAQRLIDIRMMAVRYLKDTAKFCLHLDKHPNTLSQLPRMFAYPQWQVRPQIARAAVREEIPFMEFSS